MKALRIVADAKLRLRYSLNALSAVEQEARELPDETESVRRVCDQLRAARMGIGLTTKMRVHLTGGLPPKVRRAGLLHSAAREPTRSPELRLLFAVRAVVDFVMVVPPNFTTFQ